MPKSLLIRRSLLLRLLSAIILLFNFAVLKSQDLQNFAEVNIIPPSPNVAAFQKFVDIPVSLYTGTPDITVPVFQIQMSQLSLPIDLKYHASGLKVEEQASWVGAGWTLSAGGSISRSAKGLPDEQYLSSLGQKGMFYNTRMFHSDGRVNLFVVQNCDYDNVYLTTPEDPVTNADSVAQGLLDLEPDIYHFSFPEGSGKFSFTYNCKNGPCEIVKFTDDDVKILEHPFDDNNNFPSVAIPDIDYKWVIQSPNGTIYTFEDAERTKVTAVAGSTFSPYNPSLDYYQSAWQLSKIELNGEWIEFDYEDETQVYELKISESASFKISGNGPQSSFSYNRSNTESLAKRISKITTSNGYEINFIESNSSRLDLTGSKRLNYIEVLKDGSPVKYLHLNYEYFGSNEKLKLVSVVPTKDMVGSDSINGYNFDYFPGLFPAKDSRSQDYWGYHNGNMNLNSIIPPYKTELFHFNQNSLTSREPNLNSAKIGTLKRVTYPTGGSLELFYELHEAYDENRKVTYVAEAEAVNSEDKITLLELTSDVSATIVMESEETLYSYVLLKRWDGNSYQTYSPSLYSTGNRFLLPAGQYELFAHQDTPGTAKITVEYEKVEPGHITVGGLRINKTVFNDPVNQSSIMKGYEYISESLNRSSGLLFTPNQLGGHISTYIEGEMASLFSCQDLASDKSMSVSSFSQIPLSVYSGNHIGYSEVKEFYTKQLSTEYELGYTKHEFVNKKDTVPPNYPYVAQKDYGHKNGKLFRQTMYKKVGSNYKKVKSTVNEYQEEVLSDIVYGMNFKRTISSFCFKCVTNNFGYREFFIKPTWYNLTKTTETEYDDLEQPTISTVSTFDYEPITQHNFPISKKYSTSEGDTLQELYIRDVNYPQLVTEFQLFKEEVSSNKQIAGRKVAYSGINPEEYFEWDTDDNSYVKKRKANYTDAVLNEVITNPELSGEGSATTAYIYGYNDSYPVIESKNQTYAELSTSVANAINALPGYSNGLSDLDNLLSDVLANGASDTLWKQFNDALRAESQMLNKQYMTYTYKPGVGISTITDANGECQYYIYDDFNRLIEIRDSQKDLVKSIVYHYMSQN